MPLIVQAEYTSPYGMDVADSIADLSPERQLVLICREMSKPARLETVRRKFTQYWPIISGWRDERPDLFDAAIYELVAELENRHASEPDGIRHLREIASTEISE